METPEISLEQGRAVIKRYSENMSAMPGVYRMIDAAGNVLYVGKARHLKNRVSSYLNAGAQNTRIQRMIAQTASMEIISTRSEAEALLLEANLIKKFSPRYNVLLKDDKSFPYIFFSGDHDYARLGKHRGAKTKKGKYFGPFVSAGAVNETLTLLQKAFLLRTCSDSVFKNRSRPCMLYQIKRCSGPCVNKISKEDYGALVGQAEAFLSGASRQIQESLIAEMQRLSLGMQYEKARIIRDRIRALAQVQQQPGMDNAVGDADVIALARDGKECCVQLFSFRGGRNYGNKSWFPLHSAGYTEAEILQSAIGQHYQAQPIPPLILTSHTLEETSLIEEALQLSAGHKVVIAQPQRGEKQALMQEVLRNAKEALERHLAIHVSQQQALEGVRALFGLDEAPARIEVYDNSHISGTHAVGAMIVAGLEGFMKSEYRIFNIKREDTVPGDDYAMLREVLTRRFKRLQEAEEKKPDLVLIDGGAGQLSTAAAVFADLGVQVCYAGIAKGPDRNAGREQFFVPGKEPFQLPPGDPVLHYLQRLRDEAHRFAIGAHRNRRSKGTQTSELDAIPSIGPGRKKALLLYFGSAKAVANASMEELEKVEGISKSTAQVIYAFFHSGQ